MSKRYRLTQETLGDAFGEKVIEVDTVDVVAYILREVSSRNGVKSLHCTLTLEER